MSSKRVLLVASAVFLLAVPAISLAQENQNNSAESEQKSGRHQDQGEGAQATPQGQARPQGKARSQEQGTQRNQARSQDQRRSREQGAQPSQAKSQDQRRSPGQGTRPSQARSQDQGKSRSGETSQNRSADTTRHVEQRTQWRSGHADWTRNTAWQRDPNWWRARPVFRGYSGPRPYFFFAPGYGYYRVPQAYWGQRWATGAFLPSYFLRYEVNDYRDYGLPPPPYGCAWVWVSNDVLLVDLSDGYILDEIDNVW
jgi:Ni/Co efflux regulator RcnB